MRGFALGLALPDVPNFAAAGVAGLGWFHALRYWLGQRGLGATVVYLAAGDRATSTPGTLAIAFGPSRACDWPHAVVVEATHAGWKLIHDPNPLRDGLAGEPTELVLIHRLDHAVDAP